MYLAVLLVTLAGAALVLDRLESSIVVPSESPRYETTADPKRGRSALGSRLDRTRRRRQDGLRPFATPQQAPSSQAVDASEFLTRSYISIVVDDADLNDSALGLLTNPMRRGRSWEVIAYASYFEGTRLVWESRVGLRVHGGVSRRRGDRRSWRLYFGDEFGSDTSRRSALAELAAAPERLVVRRERTGYPNAIALEIAKQIGAVTPAFRSVRAFLNGEDLGDYILVEHLNPKGWGRSHFGHRDFSMRVYRGQSSDDSKRRYRELTEWVATTTPPLTMAAVSQRVDLDNMLRHLFTYMFSGTHDWAQGAAVLDHTRDDGKWFWVHWDLDFSFFYQQDVAGPGVGLIVDGMRQNEVRDVRTRIFNRLRLEDPAFAAHFVSLATELLNDNLGGQFFDELLEQYSDELLPTYRAKLREYFRRRPEILRRELAAYFSQPSDVRAAR